MSKKITFIGAGSFGFTRELVKDLLTFPAFEDATICLMDIDEEKLEIARKCCQKIADKGNRSAKIITTTDRVEALKGADGVACTILSGDVDVWKYDIEIPKKYGVDINVGDTRGPAAIFRALRTIPVMLDICADIEKYCPKAVFLNYTNPMAMLCRAMQEKFPKLTISGLCHSVQGTSKELAAWIGAPYEEITYVCAGINHQAHFIEFKWNGEDAYPLIYKAVTENEEIAQKELVRIDMYKHLGYYVTESSGHNSEYVAWYRKRPDLIEKYCTHGTGWNTGEYAWILQQYIDRKSTWRDTINTWLEEEIDVSRGHEYAANIFNACFGDNEMFEFNGNVRNFGIIDNLTAGACVEVPVLASKNGLKPIHVGPLPDQLALLNNLSAGIEELTVKGALTGNRDLIYQACYFDPLTSAVLSLEEIKTMVDEMFEQNKEYLGYLK